MPIKRRVPRHRRAIEWSDLHRYQLEHGHDHFQEAFGEGERFDEQLAREAWEQLRAEILDDWIRERPGSRPAAWWWFESPGSLLVNGRLPYFVEHPEEMPFWAQHRPLFFGRPSISHPADAPWFWESEREYLARHRLLRKGE